MKTNLSVDGDYFKNQIKTLRKKLNECMVTGILDDDFEDNLTKLSQMEETLLTELIPYYRTSLDNTKKTSMKINSIKKLGASSFNGFLKSTLRINEKLFITSSIDGNVQFFYIDIVDTFYDGTQIQQEWTLPIKEIKEAVSYLYKLSPKEILLFGVRGGLYIISSDNFDQIPNVNGEIKVKSLEVNGCINDFGRCLAINDSLFIVENGEERLNLLELTKEKDEYSLIFHKDIYCNIPNWTVLEKLSGNYFVVGTKTGQLYFIKYENNKLTITESFNFLNEEIRKIKRLETGDGDNNSLMVMGNNGQIGILSLSEDTEPKLIKTQLNDLKGNLFDIQSKKGTAVVLSEDGIIYLFEEDFGSWHLNLDTTMENVFFTNVLSFDTSRYLLMDVDGNLNLLDIDRIDTKEDLFNLPLYG